MTDHDVIVVGAGPVGLALACLLIRRGLDVAVCEKRTGPDPRTRAIGIHPPGLRVLDAVGIGNQVRAEALALRGGDVLGRGRVLASVEFAEDRRILILPQRRTGALLRERLTALAPEALRLGCAAVSVRDEGDSARLTVESAGVRAELTASLVVVADGVRSSLRERLGIAWRPLPGAATYAMLDLPDASGGDRAALHCEPGGLVESIPLPDGMRRWVARESAGTALGELDAFRAVIERRTGLALQAPPSARPVVFRAGQHRAARSILGRIVFLGDAAHEISPIGGQGMNLGWAASLRLSSAIGVRAPDAPDLRAFERWSIRATRRVQLRARFYMSMGAPAEGIGLALREGLIRALGAPPLRAGAVGLITMRGLQTP